MKLSFELLERFFYVETGRVEPVPFIAEEDEVTEEAEEIIRLPLGFQPPPPSANTERFEDDEEYEEEVECG